METVLILTLLIKFHRGLNRTMQYGNSVVKKNMRYTQYSLNRTMQYGNRKNKRSGGVKSVFKSYYVVWKLSGTTKSGGERKRLNRTMQYGNFFTHTATCWERMFKSYYVVWKLARIKYIFEQVNPFKSYYVVWKQKYRRLRLQSISQV